MKVIATATGFYDGERRRAGAIFEVKDGATSKWFEPAKEKAPVEAKAKPAVKESAKKKEPETFSEVTKQLAEQDKPKGAQDQEVI